MEGLTRAIDDLVDRLCEVEALGVDLLWRFCQNQPLLQGAARNTIFTALFPDDQELIMRDLPQAAGGAARALYLSTLVDSETVNQSLSLVGGFSPEHPAGRMAEVRSVKTYGEAVQQMLSGCVVVLQDQAPGGLAVDAHGYKTRSIDQPLLQTVARGPQDGFIEDLAVNVSLVRRRLRDPRLVFEPLTLGALGNTPVRLAYLRGLTNNRIVGEARRRLRGVSATLILDTNFIEEAVQDDPYSPFPQMLFSERPDVVAAALAEGRFAILVDGTSNALIAPVTFWSFLQAPDDYYQRFPSATFVRLLRLILHLFAMLMPAVYIALTTFHPEMLPPALLLAIMRARQGVPFPAAVEALLMEISFEVLREAGLRLPQKLGTSLSVVGALILGQAAVFAGLVSWPVVVIVAVTAIANFAIPQWEMALAIRLMRFADMAAAAVFGLPGLMVLNVGVLVHMVGLSSFGVPYFNPVAPLDIRGLEDVFIRTPHWSPNPRPRFLAPGWRARVRPGHRPTQTRQVAPRRGGRS